MSARCRDPLCQHLDCERARLRAEAHRACLVAGIDLAALLDVVAYADHLYFCARKSGEPGCDCGYSRALVAATRRTP